MAGEVCRRRRDIGNEHSYHNFMYDVVFPNWQNISASKYHALHNYVFKVSFVFVNPYILVRPPTIFGCVLYQIWPFMSLNTLLQVRD